MEETLSQFRHQSRALQDLRQRIAPHWNDEASRRINMSYLNPHQSDDENMLVSLSEEHKSLTVATSNLDVASANALDIERLSQELADLLGYSREDLNTATQILEEHREHLSMAKAMFPEIEKAISEANSICSGIPKE